MNIRSINPPNTFAYCLVAFAATALPPFYHWNPAQTRSRRATSANSVLSFFPILHSKLTSRLIPNPSLHQSYFRSYIPSTSLSPSPHSIHLSIAFFAFPISIPIRSSSPHPISFSILKDPQRRTGSLYPQFRTNSLFVGPVSVPEDAASCHPISVSAAL